jgi:hypothetical protein
MRHSIQLFLARQTSSQHRVVCGVVLGVRQHSRVAMRKRFAAQQVDNQSEWEDIHPVLSSKNSLRVTSLLLVICLEDLRRDPAKGEFEFPLRSAREGCVELARTVEIAQLALKLRRNQNILWLQVSVDDAQLVEFGDSLHDIRHEDRRADSRVVEVGGSQIAAEVLENKIVRISLAEAVEALQHLISEFALSEGVVELRLSRQMAAFGLQLNHNIAGA